MEDLEMIIMELLVNVGFVCSVVLMVLQLVCKGDFVVVEQVMVEFYEFVKYVYKIQIQFIGMDEGSGKLLVNLIIVYFQDYLMNVMVIQDLVIDMIEFYCCLFFV